MTNPSASGGAANGRTITRVASIAGIVAFALPWVSCNGGFVRQSFTGMQLADRGNLTSLWLVPLALGAAAVLAFVAVPSAVERARRASLIIVSGVVSAGAILLNYFRTFGGATSNDPLEAALRQAFTFEYGAYVSLLGSIGVMVGGWQQKQEAANRGTSAEPAPSPPSDQL